MSSRMPALFLSAVLLLSLFTPTSANASTAEVTAAQLPSLLTVSDEPAPAAYNRDQFEHWVDADRDGCNTRYEVLVRDSTTPVSVSPGCALSGGTWVSPYDGFTATHTADIQIDHVVALAEAWRSGAWSWNDDQRRTFANDLDVAYSLTVSSGSANQSKADNDPGLWLPTNDAYVCEYATSWALVKYRWALTVDSREYDALTRLLSGACGENIVQLPTIAGPGVSTIPEGETTPNETRTEGVVTSFPEGITRLAGVSRYDTALAISARYAPGVPALFIATGTDFPDALSAAASAAAAGGPLLLTTPTALPAPVRTEINRLKPEKIYIVGGEGAVSRQVFDTVKRIAPTQRIGGPSRYDTARMLVASQFPSSETAFIATGRMFPDALAATGAAGSLGAPVVLVDGVASVVPPATVNLLRNLGTNRVVIAGETGAVSANIAAQLTNAGFAVERRGGVSRYDTAAAINDAFFPRHSSTTGFITTGRNFPDALAGAALAGALRSPIFVTEALCVHASIRESVARFGATSTAVLGGVAVVSDDAANNIGCLTAARPTLSGIVQVGRTLIARPGTWTAGTAFAYQWYANGRAISGATSSAIVLSEVQFSARISVRVTGSKYGYLTASSTSVSTVPVTRPSRTKPIGPTTCPAWAPIKGNASSMIYHMPSGAFYARTVPEECFSTEPAAIAAGYRKSKR